MSRPRIYSSDRQRQKAYRDRLALQNSPPIVTKPLLGQLVLSLFPGADLFGKSFELLGACVVRGPEKLLGQDIRDFKCVPGRFDGVIGGPPCQAFSQAAISGSNAENLIPEFVRVVEESKPRWAVMENVPAAGRAWTAWPSVVLSDWNCGGFTFRRRRFWFYGLPLPVPAAQRPGNAEYSVLATSWNHQKPMSARHAKPLAARRAAELQGFPELGERLIAGLPGNRSVRGDWKGITGYSRNVFAVHVLGNGVPAALGRCVALHVGSCLTSIPQNERN